GLTAGRAADADPHAVEVARAEVLAHRLEAVVAVVSPTKLDPQPGGVQVEFVVDRDDVIRLDLVERGHGLHGHAGQVHVGGGPDEHQLDVVGPGEHHRRDLGLLPGVQGKAGAVAVGKIRYGPVSD